MKNLATTIAIAMLFASACGGRIDQLNGRGQWIPVGNPPVGYADTPSEPEESSDAASDSEETEVSPDDEGAAGSADQVSSDAEDRGTATDDDDNFMSSNPRNPATDSGTGGSSGKEPEEIATAGTPAEPNEGTAGATTVPDEGAAGATDAEVGDDGSDAVGAAGAPNAEPELGAAGASANPDEGGAGAVDSGATYCETVASDGDTLGYWGCCGAFVQSNEVQPGTLFKGSDAAVYYMAPNGYRYLFPTTMVLDSWYGIPDANGFPQSNPSVCSSVIEIPDEGVASIPLGGNVTIRPGTYVTGTVAGTERYVVSRGGVLHEIGLDAAKGIYGVADVVDAIFNSLDTFPVRLNADFSFANYTVGSPISSAADYDLEAERAVTLEEDLGISEDVVEEEPQIPPTVTVVPPGTAALIPYTSSVYEKTG